MWESNINISEIIEIRTKSTIFFGTGAIKKIKDIAYQFKKKGYNKVIVITGKSAYIKTGAWSYIETALKENNVEYILYNKVTPNPTIEQIDEAANEAKKFGAQFVIGIGGGSSIDTAKSTAVLISNSTITAQDLFEYRSFPDKAKPIIAINLTHGTGTEADHFAVASIPDKYYKPSIAYDFIYPIYAIDDPSLMTGLSSKQTSFVTVDALNHVIEAATCKIKNPFSITLAIQASSLIEKYLQVALKYPDNLQARYYLAYASLIAGISFDNGGLHITHALEHPMSALKPQLPHGLGLGVILPSVINVIYPSVSQILSDILYPIIPELKGNPDETSLAVSGVKKWLSSVGINCSLSKLGFYKSDIQTLTDLIYNTPGLSYMIDYAPLPIDRKIIEKIYYDSF